MDTKPSVTVTCQAFTLIELSIVLVIIGLIVGGVLIGRDLIHAAEIRATIAQVEEYNTAVNAFRTKYDCLPGDCASAANFGFPMRGQYRGEGDGNGVIEGVYLDSPSGYYGVAESAGETALFWVDLSQANLIRNSFNTASANVIPPSNITNVASYLPSAKLNGNYFYVWSGGYGEKFGQNAGDGINYYGLAAISAIQAGGSLGFVSNTGLTVLDAYDIDTKMDDGLPQSGKVLALYIYSGVVIWASASGAGFPGAYNPATNGPTTAPTPASATTCYDNGNVNGTPQHYSLALNSGSNLNCALSFQFQ